MPLSDKLSVIEIHNLIECEGLDYAIQYHTSADDIEDPDLADMWERARELLSEIEAYCKDAVEDEDE